VCRVWFEFEFPFSILIDSRIEARGFANAKFELKGLFHYVSTDLYLLKTLSGVTRG
jgi:hypothetical protein